MMIMKILSSLAKLVKNKYAMVGVPVIITNQEGKILLGKRSDNHPLYPSLWNLPGGTVEYGETIEDCAKREPKEEIGVDVELIRMGGVYENLPNKDCSLHTIDIVYYGKIINGVPQGKDETSDVGWFDSYELERMKLAYNQEQILKKEGLLKIIQT